ncbi:hypothetical protein [Bacillus sp. FJAT-27251]|uniref:hypothetical protein n=1 Tax=Bacillus sp. FJAT-27251 TaxID=1684142 RepID=UPI0006A78832|nr:hypothetical protein [Bacillus sp. FJAT-27251]
MDIDTSSGNIERSYKEMKTLQEIDRNRRNAILKQSEDVLFRLDGLIHMIHTHLPNKNPSR